MIKILCSLLIFSFVSCRGGGGGSSDRSSNTNSENNGGASTVVGTFLTHLGGSTKTSGGSNAGGEDCYAVAADSSGNVYCAGYTSGDLNEAAGGSADSFIMKLSKAGAILWITHLGDVTKPSGGSTSADDRCYGVDVDSAGNVYCAGSTESDLAETNGGDSDAFVLKLNSLGVIQWVTQLGSVTKASGGNNSQSDVCRGVSVDNSGNVYCAGYTQGSIGETNARSGRSDAFVMKLNSSGALQWVTQLGATTKVAGGVNTGDDYCLGVATDQSGNVYCAGNTGGSLGEANGGSVDPFILKLNTSGAIEWVTQLGASTTATGGSNAGADRCLGVAVDSNQNVYCSGYTDGAFSEPNTKLDVFVMKVNNAGVLQWVRQLGNTTMPSIGSNSGNDYGTGVAVDKNDNVYCSGYTTSSLGETGTGSDSFVMKLDSAGAISWITQLGSTTKAVGGDNINADRCNDVAVDDSGYVSCAGFTDGTLGEANGGNRDAFVMKLNADGKLN